MTADTLAVVRIVFTLVSIIFIYAGLIFQVEQRYHPATFRSFLDVAYFAVVTMTTVGYGDITPVSDIGRLLTMLMILTGIALIPTQLGDLIRRVIKASQAVPLACSGCGWPRHDADASFCKRCGTSLTHLPADQRRAGTGADGPMPAVWPQVSQSLDYQAPDYPAALERPGRSQPATAEDGTSC